MKKFIALFIIKILKKLDISIILNFKLENNTATCKKKYVFFYGNTLIDFKTFSTSGNEFQIPNYKFKFTKD